MVRASSRGLARAWLRGLAPERVDDGDLLRTTFGSLTHSRYSRRSGTSCAAGRRSRTPREVEGRSKMVDPPVHVVRIPEAPGVRFLWVVLREDGVVRVHPLPSRRSPAGREDGVHCVAFFASAICRSCLTVIFSSAPPPDRAHGRARASWRSYPSRAARRRAVGWSIRSCESWRSPRRRRAARLEEFVGGDVPVPDRLIGPRRIAQAGVGRASRPLVAERPRRRRYARARRHCEKARAMVQLSGKAGPLGRTTAIDRIEWPEDREIAHAIPLACAD